MQAVSTEIDGETERAFVKARVNSHIGCLEIDCWPAQSFCSELINNGVLQALRPELLITHPTTAARKVHCERTAWGNVSTPIDPRGCVIQRIRRISLHGAQLQQDAVGEATPQTDPISQTQATLEANAGGHFDHRFRAQLREFLSQINANTGRTSGQITVPHHDAGGCSKAYISRSSPRHWSYWEESVPSRRTT